VELHPILLTSLPIPGAGFSVGGFGFRVWGVGFTIGIEILGYLKKTIDLPWRKGGPNIISMIEWTRTSRLSIKNSLSVGFTSAHLPPAPPPTAHPASPSVPPPVAIVNLIRPSHQIEELLIGPSN
jgi:hypothetical protein